jgi:hypothetical protein
VVKQLREAYSDMQVEWRTRIRFFTTFTRNRPLQFYAQDGEVAAEFTSLSPASVEIPEDEDLSSKENQQPMQKKHKIDARSEARLGGTRDPFLMCAALSRPQLVSKDNAPTRQSTTRQMFENSALGEDIRILRKGNEGRRKEIIVAAQFLPWYQDLLNSLDSVKKLSDDELDEVWVWTTASSLDREQPEVNLTVCVQQLLIATLRSSLHRLKPTLARVLLLWDCLDRLHQSKRRPAFALS